jgi:hypothetical protein
MGALTGALIANEPIGPYGAVSHMRAVQVKNRCKSAWGVSAQQAEKALETGLQLAEHPEAARAALDGDLSVDQAALVTETARGTGPGMMSFLLSAARRSSLTGLSAECRRVRQFQADETLLGSPTTGDGRDGPGGPEGGSLSAPSGSLRSWLDRQGRWHLSVCGDRDDGERVMAAIEGAIPDLVSADGGADLAGPSAARMFYQGLVGLCDAAPGMRAAGRGDQRRLEVGRPLRRPATRSRWRWAGAPVGPFPERPPFPIDGLDWLFAPVETAPTDQAEEAPAAGPFGAGATPERPG